MVLFSSTYFCLYYKKSQVKKSVEVLIAKGIDEENLVLLTFTEKEAKSKLNWIHSKEFRYNNDLYDIVSSETIDDITYYWCWKDTKEKKIEDQLKEVLARVLGNDLQNKDAQKNLAKFYKSLFFKEVKQSLLKSSSSTQDLNIVFYLQDVNLPCLYSNAPPTPPPQYI